MGLGFGDLKIKVPTRDEV